MQIDQKPQVLVCCSSSMSIRSIYAARLSSLASIRYLEDAGEDRVEWLSAADVLVCFLPHSEVLDAEWSHVRARLLQIMTSGVNHLRATLFPQSMTVASLPAVQSEAIAEHALGMALGAAKRLVEFRRLFRNDVFDMALDTRMLRGGVCCVIGLGNVGRAIARLFRAIGMNVTAVNRSGQSDEPGISAVGRFQDIDAMIADADVVVLAIALTDETVDLVDEHRLRSMKDDAILVNVARGRVVNQAALYAHLLSHPSFHACIDVWWEEPFNEGRFHLEYPFFELSNLIGTPHCASRVPAMPAIMAEAASDNVFHFLQAGGSRQPQ